MKFLFIYAVGWLGLVVLAILNGAAREKIYAASMSELSAHQVSTIVGVVLFGVYIWVFIGLFPADAAWQTMAVGAMWLAMTIVFEFVFGRWVMGHPWDKLLHDYNLLQGRIWLLVPIWIAVAPYFFFRVRS